MFEQVTETELAECTRPTRLDRLIAWVAPQRAFRRLAYRRALELSYRSPVFNRLDRGRRRTQTAEDVDVIQDLRDKARDLVANNPKADAAIDRVIERIIGPGIRMVAATGSKTWNKQHSERFRQWAEDEADVRRLTDWSGLQAFITTAQIVDGRVGIILMKSRALQLVHADRIKTPPKLAGNDRIIDGVEYDRLGRVVRVHIVDDPDAIAETYTSVPARYFVYFPLRRFHDETLGVSKFKASYDNFEQVDGIVEAVTAAAQNAALFSLLIKEEGESIITQAQSGLDSQGRGVKLFDLEPGTAQAIGSEDTIEQVVPQHPQENLQAFIQDVDRSALSPIGVSLEALLLNYSRINYSGARSMELALDAVAKVFRARYLYPGFRRIYRWVTSKLIKAGELPEVADAWRMRFIPPGREWVDPEKSAKGNLLSLDMHETSPSQIVEARYGVPFEEHLDMIAQDHVALAERGLELVHSGTTRDRKVVNNGKAR